MEMSNRSELLGNYDVRKLLIKLTIPAAAGMIVNALYNLVDTIFVARGVGEDAVAGLGFAFPVQMLIMAFGLMIGVGAASVFSRAYGRKDHVQMRHVANTAIRIDFILALVFSVGGYFLIGPMLELFRATEDNIGYATKYLQIILYGLVPLTLSMVLNNLTRAEGRPRIAMYSMVIGAGLNILLDPIFIFVFDMGVEGAAIATVISQVAGFIFIFTQAQSKRSELRLNLKDWLDIDLKTIWEIIKIGFPTFLRNAIGALLVVLVYLIIDVYGAGMQSTYQAVYSVVNRLLRFLLFPAFGLIQGLAPIAGFNYGAKKYKRLYDVVIFAIILMVSYLILMFVFVQLLAPDLFRMLSKNLDPDFITHGARIFRIISIGFILVGFQIILGSMYQSFGYSTRAILVAISRQFILFVPISLVLTRIFNLDGLWYTFPVSDLTSGFLSLMIMIYELYIIRKKFQNTTQLS